MLPVAALAVLALAPSTVSRGTEATLFTLVLYAGLAQAWNIIGGFGGQLSLGHAAFVGAGAYTAGMLFVKTDLPLAAAMPLAGVVAAGIAIVVSVALLRVHGAYFSIGTLAFALALQAWMVTWNYTGASQALNIPFDDVPSADGLYYVALGLTGATTAVAATLTRSRFGLRLMAVREDEDAAAGLGVAGTQIKLLAFVISAFLTGLLGCVVALNQITLTPDNLFGLDWTIKMVVIAIVGGIGTVEGPLVGAVVVYYLIEKQLEGSPTLSLLLTGALIVVVIAFLPGGIWGGALSLARRARATVRSARVPRPPLSSLARGE